MPFIDIDYRDTLQKAARLEQLAADLRKISSSSLANLQSCAGRTWRGSSSELYKKRMKTLCQQANSQAKELQNVAASLRRAAEQYRLLEQTAHSLFGGR